MNYSDLQTAINTWTDNSYSTAQVKQFITLAEAEFNRNLRALDMEVRSTAALTEAYLALPSDFLALRAIKISEAILEPATPGFIRKLREQSGKPVFYAIADGQFQFAPTPDTEYEVEIIYFARLAALSDSNTSNWLLAAHPDLYLAKSLSVASMFGWNDERASGFGIAASAIMDQINSQENARRYGTVPRRMILARATP